MEPNSLGASLEESKEDGLSHSKQQNWKRKSLGRSARRRKAKLRAIQKAEESLWKNNGESFAADQVVASLLPSDRDKVWPGVLERRKGVLGKPEQAALVGQLGFLPGNALAIAAMAQSLPCLPLDQETPIVLKLYPLAVRDAYAGGKADGRKFKGRRRGGGDDNVAQSEEGNAKKTEQPLLEPFPTLYWLTHPMLRTLISKLEVGSQKNVHIMEERLRSDQEAMASMKRAHEAYGRERWELLTTSDLQMIETRQWQGALGPERGVAGIRKHDCIKCLHAHAAHYLSGGQGSSDNVVGKWVVEAVSELVRERQAILAANATADNTEANNAR